MKIINSCEQGDLDWLKLRMGKVTASEAASLLTPAFKVRTGEMPNTLMCRKLVETIQGRPTPVFGSWETDQGHIIEEEAIPWFELEHDCEVIQPAFVEHDNGRCGCSPDGLIYENGIPISGLEVKSPQAVQHMKYLLNGGVPDDYIVQVHFSLYVTGLQSWKFLSYRRGLPKLVVEVKRDCKICVTIGTALGAFYERYDNALSQVRRLAA